MKSGSTFFSGPTRSADGVIVTFDLDGERFSKQFLQVLHTVGWKSPRKVIRDPLATPIQQAISYADQHGLKIVCVSSPETILRDLSGRGQRGQTGTDFPEQVMLQGRMDLFLRPDEANA